MKLVNNLKIKVKFLGPLFLAIFAMVAVVFVGAVSMGSINEANDVIYGNNYLSTVALETINNGLSDVRRDLAYIVQEYYRDRIGDYKSSIDNIAKICQEAEAQYKELIVDDEDAKLFAAFQNAMADFRIDRSKVITYAQDGEYENALSYLDTVARPAAEKTQECVEELVSYNTRSAQESVDSANSTYKSSITILLIVAGISGALSIVIGLYMSGAVTKPLKVAVSTTNSIANGDLTVVLAKGLLSRKDEIGELAKGIKGMQEGLIQTVEGIKNASVNLGSQVTDTNQTIAVLNDKISDTSAATEELSASMEETGASSEEMNATAVEIEHAVETVAEKAEDGAAKSGEIHNRASELGKHVKESIKKSNDVFNEIKGSLEQALEDSKAVDEINALADAILGITSQTTLLALNASIEAARAGEAGRGFAVVANEISSLADNSKNTVTQIQAITKVVMTAVNNLASSSNNLLNFVAKDVMSDYKGMEETAQSYTDDATYVSDLTNDLSATAEELLASVQVLMRAIGEVSSAAQEGARTTTTVAEQTSDISMGASTIVDNMKETQKTSDELTALVDKFKLKQ